MGRWCGGPTGAGSTSRRAAPARAGTGGTKPQRPGNELPPVKALRRFTVRAHLPKRLAALAQLSTNLRWSWDVATQELFESIDPEQWARAGRDPVGVLGAVSPARLDELAGDHGFLGRLDRLAADLDEYLTQPRWYQHLQENSGGETALPDGIGYFSMEFGVAEVLPIYSGGLGILAGDHLKAASDLGVPMIGVGLNYRSGYFRQSLPPTAGSTRTTRRWTRRACRCGC